MASTGGGSSPVFSAVAAAASGAVPPLKLPTSPLGPHFRSSPAFQQALSRISAAKPHSLPFSARAPAVPEGWQQGPQSVATIKATAFKLEDNWLSESLPVLRSRTGTLVRRLRLIAGGHPAFSPTDAVDLDCVRGLQATLKFEADIIATRADGIKATFGPVDGVEVDSLVRQAIRRRTTAQTVCDALEAAVALHRHSGVCVSAEAGGPQLSATTRRVNHGISGASLLSQMALDGQLTDEESFVRAVRDSLSVVSISLIQDLRKVWQLTNAAVSALSTVKDTAKQALACGIVAADGILDSDVEPVTLYVIPYGSDLEEKQEWVRRKFKVPLGGSHGCEFYLLANARGDVLLEKRYAEAGSPDAEKKELRDVFWARVHEAAAVKQLAGHAPATLVRYLRVTREVKVKGGEKPPAIPLSRALSRSTSASLALPPLPPLLLQARTSAGAALGSAASEGATSHWPLPAAAAGAAGSASATAAAAASGVDPVGAVDSAAAGGAGAATPVGASAATAAPCPEARPAAAEADPSRSVYMEFASGGTLKSWIDEQCMHVHIESGRSGGLSRRGGERLGFGHVSQAAAAARWRELWCSRTVHDCGINFRVSFASLTSFSHAHLPAFRSPFTRSPPPPSSGGCCWLSPTCTANQTTVHSIAISLLIT